MLHGGPFNSGAPRLFLPCLPSRDAAVCVCACARVCVRACVPACVRACVRACVPETGICGDSLGRGSSLRSERNPGGKW